MLIGRNVSVLMDPSLSQAHASLMHKYSANKQTNTSSTIVSGSTNIKVKRKIINNRRRSEGVHSDGEALPILLEVCEVNRHMEQNNSKDGGAAPYFMSRITILTHANKGAFQHLPADDINKYKAGTQSATSSFTTGSTIVNNGVSKRGTMNDAASVNKAVHTLKKKMNRLSNRHKDGSDDSSDSSSGTDSIDSDDEHPYTIDDTKVKDGRDISMQKNDNALSFDTIQANDSTLLPSAGGGDSNLLSIKSEATLFPTGDVNNNVVLNNNNLLSPKGTVAKSMFPDEVMMQLSRDLQSNIKLKSKFVGFKMIKNVFSVPDALGYLTNGKLCKYKMKNKEALLCLNQMLALGNIRCVSKHNTSVAAGSTLVIKNDADMLFQFNLPSIVIPVENKNLIVVKPAEESVTGTLSPSLLLQDETNDSKNKDSRKSRRDSLESSLSHTSKGNANEEAVDDEGSNIVDLNLITALLQDVATAMWTVLFRLFFFAFVIIIIFSYTLRNDISNQLLAADRAVSTQKLSYYARSLHAGFLLDDYKLIYTSQALVGAMKDNIYADHQLLATVDAGNNINTYNVTMLHGEVQELGVGALGLELLQAASILHGVNIDNATYANIVLSDPVQAAFDFFIINEDVLVLSFHDSMQLTRVASMDSSTFLVDFVNVNMYLQVIAVIVLQLAVIAPAFK